MRLKMQPEWEKEAGELGIDLASETESPTFCALLRSGVGVKTAFDATHPDELRARLEIEAERKIRRNMHSGGENGLKNEPSAPKKALTREERAEMVRRTKCGERISL